MNNIINVTGIVSQTPTRYKLKENLLSLSQDDFTITNTLTGTNEFLVQRKLTSFIRQEKTLTDLNGNVIWIMKHPLFKLFRRRYKFYDANGTLLFKIRNKMRLIPGRGKKLTLTLPSGQTILSLGQWFDLETPIALMGRDGTATPLAKINKSLISARGLVTGLSSYDLNVNAGVDIPMCFGFVVVLDEERERQGGTTGGPQSPMQGALRGILGQR
jgi:uncharacterized protein YxjI